jgi:hypothetical protein
MQHVLQSTNAATFNNIRLLNRNEGGEFAYISCCILIYIQQDATLHSLFYLENTLHVSGGTITHHQERKQLYLRNVVFVTPLLLPAAIVEELELLCYRRLDGT